MSSNEALCGDVAESFVVQGLLSKGRNPTVSEEKVFGLALLAVRYCGGCPLQSDCLAQGEDLSRYGEDNYFLLGGELFKKGHQVDGEVGAVFDGLKAELEVDFRLRKATGAEA